MPDSEFCKRLQMLFRMLAKQFALTARFKAMKNGNHRIWLSILFASFLISAGQLPPEIMADRHMIRLDRLISEIRHHEAYRLTSEIAEFFEKHNLELPHEFHFKQARIASSLGLLKEGITALHTYLNKAGKEGAHYVDALQLLDRTEEKLREAEAERKRMEEERRRAEAIRKRHTELVNRQIESASVPLARDPLRSGGLGPEMVTVAKGSFHYPYTTQTIIPGDETGRYDTRVQRVEIDQPFAISKHEITRGEFMRFVKATRYRTEAEQRGSKCRQVRVEDRVKNASWKRLGFVQTDAHPVVCVSRRDAMGYAKWLSRETGRSYRLPTLVEWQYAARAGSDFAMLDRGRDSEGRANHNHCGRANLDEDSRSDVRCVDGVEHTAQVGNYPPNNIGLHDMIGNVSEWVSSCFIEGKGLLPQDENADHCDTRHQVNVGGAFYHAGLRAYRTSYETRSYYNDELSHDHVGFRLVKDFELRAGPEEKKTGNVVE